MAARYLSRKSGRGILFSPFVEVEINGADYDNAKYKTKSVSDNGFNPDWNDSFDFQIHNPDLAMYVLLTCFYESWIFNYFQLFFSREKIIFSIKNNSYIGILEFILILT